MAREAKPPKYAELFLELADPNELGFSREVSVEEFVDKYACLVTRNGNHWARESSYLGKKYIIERKSKGKGNAITHIQLYGLKKTQQYERRVSSAIRKEIRKRKCAVLHVSNIEVDHKDGRYDDPKVSDITTQKVEDFQALSKCVNNAKRQHCKVCRETGKRFDATLLGYKVGQVNGNGKYRGTCVGCYWHDPIRFNSSLDLIENLNSD